MEMEMENQMIPVIVSVELALILLAILWPAFTRWVVFLGILPALMVAIAYGM
jgi:hypothetical protein